jgi:hypothetical protein
MSGAPKEKINPHRARRRLPFSSFPSFGFLVIRFFETGAPTRTTLSLAPCAARFDPMS